jgi:hypothetical protein
MRLTFKLVGWCAVVLAIGVWVTLPFQQCPPRTGCSDEWFWSDGQQWHMTFTALVLLPIIAASLALYLFCWRAISSHWRKVWERSAARRAVMEEGFQQRMGKPVKVTRPARFASEAEEKGTGKFQ